MDDTPTPPDVAVAPDPTAANQHLRQIAIAELGDVRAVLAATGHDLEASRSHCRALLAELEATHVGLEATHVELSQRQDELDDTRASLRSTQEALSRSTADAQRAAQESATTFRAQRDHIIRLRTQIQSPWRLIIKWCLRRAPYSTPRN